MIDMNDDDGDWIDRDKYNWLGAVFRVNGPDGVHGPTPRWAEALAAAKATSMEVFARKTKRRADRTLCVEMLVTTVAKGAPDTYISQWWFEKPDDFIRVDLTKPDNSYEV